MPELLVELLSEDVPARMQQAAADGLLRRVTDALAGAGLPPAGARAFATPRRLVIAIEDVPERQADVREERKGPRVGAPDAAVQGFLRSVGLTSLDGCERRGTNKGEVWVAVIDRPGRSAAEVLPQLLADQIKALGWPKSMRWGTSRFRWVRPLQGVLAIFAGQPLRGGLDLDGAFIPFSAQTAGHRFLAPQRVGVGSFADYAAGLRAARVVIDADERRAIIEDGIAALARREGLRLRDDPALAQEVAGLVEWPVPLLGSIDARFMALPPEVLTASMRAHQKYFSLIDADGRLAPRFALVANIETPDGGRTIVAGNERVLRARLSDAEFFWNQDRKTSLADRAAALSGMIFHARLGTLDQKVDRMQALAVAIAPSVPGADRDRVRSAARLAKADLTSGMVGEFPELQGIMGRYYALAAGEHEDVALAIAEHYAPQGPGDACPSAPVSVCVALADKLDTLVGFWAVDEKPTGSRDPYALRRSALGVLRLIEENSLRLRLRDTIRHAHALLPADVRGGAGEADAVADSLLTFFADRLKVHLRERGVRHDLIAAVFALGGEDDIVRLLARVDALGAFLGTADGANLLTAYRRAANIVAIEQKRDGRVEEGPVDPDALVEDEETQLFQALEQASKQVIDALKREQFAAAMTALAQLRVPVDAFFDNVTVNTDVPALRRNRLRLLSSIRSVMNRIAAFGQIEG